MVVSPAKQVELRERPGSFVRELRSFEFGARSYADRGALIFLHNSWPRRRSVRLKSEARTLRDENRNDFADAGSCLAADEASRAADEASGAADEASGQAREERPDLSRRCVAGDVMAASLRLAPDHRVAGLAAVVA